MKAAEPKSAAISTIQKKSNTPFFDTEHASEQESPFFAPQEASGTDAFFQPATRPIIQTKLTVGQPNDKYEQEADNVADKVVQRLAKSDNDSTTNPKSNIRNPKSSTPSVSESSTPIIHHKTEAPEEEKLDRKEDSKEELPELQKSPVSAVGDDEGLQMKCAACEAEEDSGHIQMKGNTEGVASSNIEAQLNSSKGGGSALPDTTRTQMESAMGADFSNVRVHTGSSAVQMSQDLNAQAFTHGSDVYFNEGKYNPSGTEGGRLLAHELVHTVQQGASVHRKAISDDTLSNNLQKEAEPIIETVGTDAFSRTVVKGHSNGGSIVQTKLTVGGANDKYEQEADSVADNVVQRLANTETVETTATYPDTKTPNQNAKTPVVADTPKPAIQPKTQTDKDRLDRKDEDKELEDLPEVQRMPVSGVGEDEEMMQRKPSDTEGSLLLARELTHTVQQRASSTKVAKKSIATNSIPTEKLKGKTIQRGIRSWGRSAWNATGGALIDMGADALRSLVNRIAPGLLDFLRGDILGNIKSRITSAIDSLTGGLFSHIQTEGLASILRDLLGAGFSAIGTGVSEGCAALARVARKLWDFAKKLTGPAIAAFKKIFDKVGGFLSDLWKDFGKPAWEAIKHYAGRAWDWIVEKATWLWDKTAPVRNAIGRAWNWVKEQFGIAWGNTTSVLDWLKEKAIKAWDWIKAKIQPIIGPLKVIGAILVMISPVGPIIAIYKGAPYIWKAIKWLASNFNKHVIIKAKDYLYNEILPIIESGLAWIQSTITDAMAWLREQFTALGNAITRLFNSLSGFALFRMIRSGIQRIGRGIRRGINYVAGKAASFGRWIGSIASKTWQKLAPVREFLRQLLLITTLGPLSILDDGVWETVKSIIDFALKVPCVKEIGELFSASTWVQRIDSFRQAVKFAWHLLTHPDELQERVRAFLEPYIQEAPNKANSQLTSLLANFGISTARHLAGILRHLNPAIAHLLANWWTEAKKMIWFLVWPFAEGSPIYTDTPKLWNLIPQIWGDLWSGNFRRVRDGFLEWWQALNMVAGAFAGWIAIGGAIVGAIIGSFAGGVGALPGAGAGFEVGVMIGEGIMVSMIANEFLIIRSALDDLVSLDGNEESRMVATNTTPLSPNTQIQTRDTHQAQSNGQSSNGEHERAPTTLHSGDIHTDEQRIEYAYQRIANSALTLGIMLALVLLGAIGGKIASAISSGLKKIGGALAERFPNAARALGEMGKGMRESRLGQALSEFNEGRKMASEGRGGSGRVEEEGRRTEIDTENLTDEHGGRPSENALRGLDEDMNRLRERVNDPNNISEVRDPQYRELYDVEVEVGDHTFRRDRRTGRWCRFSDPACGINIPEELNAKVNQATSSRPEWLRNLDEGNNFNTERRPYYESNEVYIEKPNGDGYYRLDSYNPSTGEIVSRKFTQFSEIQETTGINYVNELASKYPPGSTIAEVPSSGNLAGQTLHGQMILEVPVQGNPIPQTVLDAANRRGVIIRDINLKIW